VSGVYALTIQDSPASTSSLTYTVEGRCRLTTNSGTSKWVPTGTSATSQGSILLQEVA